MPAADVVSPFLVKEDFWLVGRRGGAVGGAPHSAVFHSSTLILICFDWTRPRFTSAAVWVLIDGTAADAQTVSDGVPSISCLALARCFPRPLWRGGSERRPPIKETERLRPVLRLLTWMTKIVGGVSGFSARAVKTFSIIEELLFLQKVLN